MRFMPTDFDALSVQISELLVATADGSDTAIDQAVPEVLKAVREKLGMDVVFVSEFTGGKRVFRFVESAPNAPRLEVDGGGALEESYCQRVVDGRMPELVQDVAALPNAKDLPKTPFRVGAHLSTPIRMPDGHAYGTLCCFSTAANPELQHRDLEALRLCAQLVARKIDTAAVRGQAPDWSIAPVEPCRR